MTAKTGLDIVGIPTLFQGIAGEKKTGTLRIQHELGEKYVYLRSGKIVQVSSPQKPSILAEGLRRHPDLDDASYRAICEEQKKTGKSLAALLLADESGVDTITAICQFQILEEICQIFTWQNCHSEFTEGEPDPMLFDLETMNIEPVDSGMVLLEAARRTDEWKLIQEVLPSRKDVPYKTGKKETEIAAEEKRVYTLVDGFRDIDDILELVRLSPFEAMNTLTSLVKKEAVAIKTGKELLQMSKLDVSREDLRKSTRLSERALELGEKSKELIVWLAHAYETMGIRDKAAQQYYELGYGCMQSNFYPAAIRAFEKATQLNPESVDAHERLASLLARVNRMEEYAKKTTTFAKWLSMQGDRERAMLVLKEATEKYPSHVGNLDLLASLYQESGDRLEAVHVYKDLAQLQINTQNHEGAAKTYIKILLLDRDNLEVRKALGENLEKIGRIQEALEHYRAMGNVVYNMGFGEPKSVEYLIFVSNKIIAQQPNDVSARKWLAEAYLASGNKEKATEQWKEILSRIDEKQNLNLLVDTLKSLTNLQPKELDNRFKLAETYIKIKREREAVQEFFAAGNTAAEMGNISKALEAFDCLLSIDPANHATRMKKAEIFVRQNEKAKAIEEMMLAGYLSMGADKLWQAVKAFREALNLDKNKVQCYLELAKLYERLGKPQEAAAVYKKHIQKSVKLNNLGLALESCAAILAQSPNHSWALAAKKKIVEILPKTQIVQG